MIGVIDQTSADKAVRVTPSSAGFPVTLPSDPLEVIAATDFALSVSTGGITGKVSWSSVGENDSLGETTTGEDIWNGSATSIPVPPDVGEQMTVVSGNGEDTATTGDGVRTLRIEYLDGSGEMQTEDIDMAGTTPVDTVATDISFVNDMYATSVGDTGVAEGAIIIYKKGAAATIYNMISIGGNKSMTVNRKIPSDKTYHVTGWTVTEAKGKETSYRLRANCTPDGSALVGDNDCFLFKRVAYIKQDQLAEVIEPPIPIASGALLKITGWSVGGGGKVNVSFNGYLVDN